MLSFKCITVSVLHYGCHKIAQIDSGWTPEGLWKKQKEDSPGCDDMFSSGSSVSWDITREYSIP